jgi:hypothetical protein
MKLDGKWNESSTLHHKFAISWNFNTICVKIIKHNVCENSMGFKV